MLLALPANRSWHTTQRSLYLLRPEDWSERLVGFSFWALNLGLAWMVFANLFPLGVFQLGDSVANGYWH